MGGTETFCVGLVGKSGVVKSADKKRETLHESAKGLVPAGVRFRKAGDRCGAVARDQQGWTVRTGRKQQWIERQELETLALQVKIAGDFRGEGAREVSEARDLEPGKEFFRDRNAADDVALFQDQDFLSSHGEVSGGDEPVVAGADDDGVVVRHGGLDKPHFHVFQDFQGRQSPGGRHDAASGVRAGAAHVEILDRRAVLGPAGHRPEKEKLVQGQLALKNVALGQTKLPLQVPGRDDLPMKNDVF